VLLEIEDSFTREREALLAFRDSTNFGGWRESAKAGWADLNTFTEPEELRTCHGVSIEDGHVTSLHMAKCNLSGLCTYASASEDHK
jgi:hypothetical protein